MLTDHKKGEKGVFMEGKGLCSTAAEEHKAKKSIKKPWNCYLMNTVTKFFWKQAMSIWDTEITSSRMNKGIHRSQMVSKL